MCGCGTRQHAKTKIECRKRPVALMIEHFLIFQKKRRKAVALMIEHRKKAAAFTIERFFYLSEEEEKGSVIDD